ncbi:MAG: VTT domain-containing protein [Gemmataceae bacterium]|nr:VTT domain-containing protein [Gemmataceae bacterium]
MTRSAQVRLVFAALALWVLLATAASRAQEVPSSAPQMPQAQEEIDLWSFIKEVCANLFNSRALMATLGRPQYMVLAFLVLNLIVFTETGLLIGFFLPGDSLLVTAGLVAYLSGWNLPVLLTTLCLSAIIGDSVGYSIGFKTGPKIFNRQQSWLFHRDHLLKAQRFYERHGGKTIVLARFMPILRTFAPVVAGVGRMHYPRFVAFNVVGGIAWVCSMILTGYYLPTVINPALRPIFGEHFDVQDHVEKVVVIVVLLSISPGLYVWLKSKLMRPRAAATPETTPPAKELMQIGNCS